MNLLGHDTNSIPGMNDALQTPNLRYLSGINQQETTNSFGSSFAKFF